ncbi:MAG: hypothetical protein Q7R30_03150 [Acidobacteriota bacterium]|nr:hypothetical protein [Acidobacteriota bacterium]
MHEEGCRPELHQVLGGSPRIKLWQCERRYHEFALAADVQRRAACGSLDCTFTSGTGRFAGATGGYDFFLVATGQPGVFPPIFETEATITGSISTRLED